MSASEFVDGLSPRDLRAAVAVLFDWRTWARPEQLEPEGAWRTWLLMTGRGWGKTRTGAEWVRERVESGAKRIGLIGRTSADVRDVMVEGESGLLAPVGDAPALAAALVQLVAQPGLRSRFAASGRARYLTLFRGETSARDLVARHYRM